MKICEFDNDDLTMGDFGSKCYELRDKCDACIRVEREECWLCESRVLNALSELF